MQKLLFRNLIEIVFYCLWLPLILITHVIRFLLIFFRLKNPLQQRYAFEQKNLIDLNSQNFELLNKKAILAIEVSSEGELQQILPLIHQILSKDSSTSSPSGPLPLVELVYCSPSVEKAVQNLAMKYKNQLRVLRLPLLTIGGKFALRNWLTADKLVLVRYDLFPELLLYGLRANHRLYLFSASTKGKMRDLGASPFSLIKKNFWGKFMQIFDFVYTATPEDEMVLMGNL